MAYQKGNNHRHSSYNPYSRPDRGSRRSPARRPLQDEHISSINRSQVNPYGSADRRSSKDNNNSRISSLFDGPHNSGRQASAVELSTNLDSSSVRRSQLSSYSSSDRWSSQENRNPYLSVLDGPHNSDRSTGRQATAEEYSTTADSSAFGRSQLNSYSSSGRKLSQDNCNTEQRSFDGPHNSYGSRGRQTSADEYGAAADSSTFERSKFNSNSSSERKFSKDNRNSRQRSFDGPHDSYGSTGRQASADDYGAASNSSSLGRSQINSYSSRDRKFSQDNCNTGQRSFDGAHNSYSSTGRQTLADEYGTAADSSTFGRSHFNSNSSNHGKISQDNGNAEQRSFDGPHNSYSSTGRQASADEYGAAADSSTFERSQFISNSSGERKFSKDNRNSGQRSFDGPHNSYGSIGRQASADEYAAASNSSSLGRSQLNSYSSSDRKISQDNHYAGKRSYDEAHNSYGSTGRQALADEYSTAADSSIFGRSQFNCNSSSERKFSKVNRNSEQKSFDGPHNSYRSTGGQALANEYGAAADSLTFGRSQFNSNSSSERKFSQDNRNTGKRSFDEPHNSYSSTGRQASAEEFSTAVEGLSLCRSQFNSVSSSERSSSQGNTYGSADKLSLRDNHISRLSSLFDGPHNSDGCTEKQILRDEYSSAAICSSLVKSQFLSSGFTDRGYSQDVYNSGNSLSFKHPLNSCDRSGKYTSQNISDINESNVNQRYNNNARGDLSQTTRFEREDYSEDVKSFHASRDDQVFFNSSESTRHSSANLKEGKRSDADDEDGKAIVADVKSEENLLKYIDTLISAKKNDLQEAVEKYNEFVRKFDAAGRIFNDKEDRRIYLHWRREIKFKSGILKWDMTQIPRSQFRLNQFLIDETELMNQINSVFSEDKRPQANSGVPNPNLRPNVKKGKAKQIHTRVMAQTKLGFELIGLEKLGQNAKLKMELFGDLATAHFNAKATRKPFEARKIRKLIRKKLEQFGATGNL